MIKNEVTAEEQRLIDEAKKDREEGKNERAAGPPVSVSLWYANGKERLRCWIVDPVTAEVMKAHFQNSRGGGRQRVGLVGRYPLTLLGTNAELMIDWIRIDQVLFEEDDGAVSLFSARMKEADQGNGHEGRSHEHMYLSMADRLPVNRGTVSPRER